MRYENRNKAGCRRQNMIANLKKAYSIKQETNSCLFATLQDGEKLILSRQYLQKIKEKLGVK